jgi:predicted TIM-barrel fold metal-dependent hydrolase
MRVVDTHCHLIYHDRLRYPWLASVPLLNRDFTLTDYLPQARAAGITDILHMEVDVAPSDLEAEAAFTAALGHGFVGTIAGCRPESAAFPAYLDRVAANPRVRGFRRVLHTQPDDLARAPIFTENLRRLSGTGLTFDFCVLPRQIPIALMVARACPDVQFVLDHCGVPNVKDRELLPWRDLLRDIAALPNVACKLSGIVAYADPSTWTVDDLRPFAEHVAACFGWDRMVWGSDWPVCTLTADLGRWMSATRVLLSSASDEDKARVLGLNALRIYRLT